MIVKDVPESESSTDPVKKFEEAHPSVGIDSIQEDQEDASDSECKDQSLNILALATSTPHKSHDTLSLNKSSSEPSPEMPNESVIKDEDDKSPVTSGLAAPDSKDSLEVQLYSNCEDLSENFSGKEESVDDIKQRQESSESEDEREPTVNEKDISPVLEAVEFKIEEDSMRKENFEIIGKDDDTKPRTYKFEHIKRRQSEDSSDDEYEIVSKTEIDEAKSHISINQKESKQPQKASINIQSASSSDTESEHSCHSSASENKDAEVNEDVNIVESLTTTDTEPVQSRPSSSDFSDTYKKQEFNQSLIKSTQETNASNVSIYSQKILTNTTIKSENVVSRPSSSDYSDIEHIQEENKDIAAASVKDKISIFNQESKNVDSRPSSSDFSETVDKRTVIESDTDANSEMTDLVMVDSVKDKITKFNLEPTTSTDSEPRISRPSSSDYSEMYDKQTIIEHVEKDEKEELEKTSESIKDKISKFNLEPVIALENEQEIKQQKIQQNKIENFEEDELVNSIASVKDKISRFDLESTISAEFEPENEQRQSRPSSSDYSETYDKKPIIELKEEKILENIELVKPVETVKDRISKFNLESTVSSETEPEPDEKLSRPSSSDMSEFDDKKMTMEPTREELLIKPESIKDRISKFNKESTMSLENDVEQRSSRPSSSDYSDIHEKKAIFENRTDNTNACAKSTKIFNIQSKTSTTSTDTEPELQPKRSRQSSSDYSELSDKKLMVNQRNEDISEITEHTDTIIAQSVKDKVSKLNRESGTSTDTEPRQSRPTSSDYSDINEKDKNIEPLVEGNNSMAIDAEKLESNKVNKFEPGILQVTIFKAINLVNQDMFGKSDPYVKLKFRGQEFRSKTINNSLNPEWNFSTDLLISEVYDSNINIEVYDEDYGQDNFEGSLSISLSDAINKQREDGEWFNLTNCKDGKIFVSTIYTAMSSSQGSLKAFAQTDIEISKARSYSISSSSSEEGLIQDQNKVLQQSSTDSSLSNRKDKSNQEIQRQEAIDIEDKIVENKTVKLRAQSSSDYSDTDGEQKRRESSSDYDSASHRGKRRPDSFISDTSSDYDSLSNVGSRRPQSFILDDEYDIITEEEAAESEKQSKIEITAKDENDTSSSSESEGPDAKEAGKHIEVIPPPDVHKESSTEDREHDGELNGISVPQTLYIPHPTPSSVASSSPILSSDLHAEQSSINVEVDKSTVINSNTLEEIDPLVRDFENISHSNNLTKHIDAKAEKRNTFEEPKVASSVSFQSTSRRSSSSCSSLDQAQRDGSSESERSQDQQSSKKPSSN